MRGLGVIGSALMAGMVALVELGIAAPAEAEVIRGSDVAPYEFSYADCGFIVDVAGMFSSPRSMARVGRGDDASAFFGHDNYTLTETHTRRDTGGALDLTVHGLLHDVQATRITDSVFEFTMIDVAHAQLLDPDGTLLGRENGQIRRTFLFDTLGDNTPGGVFVELRSEQFRGNFGDVDLCAALSQP